MDKPKDDAEYAEERRPVLMPAPSERKRVKTFRMHCPFNGVGRSAGVTEDPWLWGALHRRPHDTNFAPFSIVRRKRKAHNQLRDLPGGAVIDLEWDVTVGRAMIRYTSIAESVGARRACTPPTGAKGGWPDGRR